MNAQQYAATLAIVDRNAAEGKSITWEDAKAQAGSVTTHTPAKRTAPAVRNDPYARSQPQGSRYAARLAEQTETAETAQYSADVAELALGIIDRCIQDGEETPQYSDAVSAAKSVMGKRERSRYAAAPRRRRRAQAPDFSRERY